MKDIELPRKVLVGDDAVYEIDEVVAELKLERQPLIIADHTTKEIAADLISVELEKEVTVIESADEQTLKELGKLITEESIGYVVGVGGGMILDAGKVCAFDGRIPFISVPTSASHDGIASPQASLKREAPTSISVHCPLGVVADTAIISKAPKRLIASGAADAISNYTAVLDWELAHREKNEYFGDYASALSRMSADIILKSSDRIYKDISVLVEALISSGVAIGIAGSSRPCSGAEHQFSHALDLIAEKPALHGEQCGVGTILSAYLHQADWELVKTSLKTIGAPVDAKGLGISEDTVIAAAVKASTIRERYTILRDGLSEKQAVDALTVTGII